MNLGIDLDKCRAAVADLIKQDKAAQDEAEAATKADTLTSWGSRQQTAEVVVLRQEIAELRDLVIAQARILVEQDMHICRLLRK
jgi:polyhydroxyalkanoate synthesis regulator phasin